MKIFAMILALMLALCGCSASEFEVLGDVYAPAQSAPLQQLVFDLPADADTQVMESNDGRLYFCDGYELAVQTFPSGDLEQTLRSITGYSRERITVYSTHQPNARRYDAVWVSASGQGDRVHRAVVLDDGAYHYCLYVGAPAQEAGSLQQSWQSLFSSVQLSG